MAEGKMEVPRLRTRCRATQVPMKDGVQVVATAVGAEESRHTLGKRGQGEEISRGGEMLQGGGRRPKHSSRGGVEATEGRGGRR